MRMAKTLELTLVVLLIVLMAYAVQTTRVIRNYGGELLTPGEIPEYHFAVITDDTTSYAWTLFLKGSEAKAAEKRVVTEVYAVKDPTVPSELDRAFEMAQLSGVDGMLVKLSNNQLAKDQILRSTERGIRVVTIGNDSPDSRRDAYIGTNKYNLGRMTAGIIDDANPTAVEVLLILGSEYTDQSGASSNSYLNGIHEYTAQNPCVSSLVVEYSSRRPAELIINDLLYRKNIRTIVCTDPMDSLRVAKVLVDLNKVGEIQLIASGDLPEIGDYLQKGTIHASLVEDYGMLGEMSVEALHTLMRNDRQSTYINIPITVLDKQSAGGDS